MKQYVQCDRSVVRTYMRKKRGGIYTWLYMKEYIVSYFWMVEL